MLKRKGAVADGERGASCLDGGAHGAAHLLIGIRHLHLVPQQLRKCLDKAGARGRMVLRSAQRWVDARVLEELLAFAQRRQPLRRVDGHWVRKPSAAKNFSRALLARAAIRR